MVTGEIVRLVREKGFGFIKGSGITGDVFFHASAVAEAFSHPSDFAFEDLEVGMRVAFEPAQGPRGPRAERVEVLALAGDLEDGSHSVEDPHHGWRVR